MSLTYIEGLVYFARIYFQILYMIFEIILSLVIYPFFFY